MIQKFGDINPHPMKCSAVIRTDVKKDEVFGVSHHPVYCGKPTRYKIVKDEEGNKTRDYDTFCPEHRAEFGGDHWKVDNDE